MRRVLYLWVPHLHTAVERLLDPGLAGQPVVVAAGSFARGAVVDASVEAEALGVGVGQSWRHARRHAPAAVFIPYEAWRYRPFTERIGDLLHERTPWVETLPGSAEEFFADLGSGSLEEGERLAREVTEAVRYMLGPEAVAGLATGKLVARTVVRCSVFGVRCSGGIRRPNTEHRTPNTVPPGAERRFLRPLSLDCLWDMQPEHRRRLGPLGLRSFGQLAAVPQRLLIEQFGPIGRWYRLLAAGIDTRRAKAWSPHPTVSSSLWVEEEEADLSLLEGYLELLARRVSEMLVATGRYARVVSLQVELAGGIRRFATRHLKAPTNLPGPLRRAARELLLQVLGVGCWVLGKASSAPNTQHPTPNTHRLTLIAGGLETRGLIQLTLFGDPDRGAALRAAIARIQDRFGEAAVSVASGGTVGYPLGERWSGSVVCKKNRRRLTTGHSP